MYDFEKMNGFKAEPVMPESQSPDKIRKIVNQEHHLGYESMSKIIKEEMKKLVPISRGNSRM